MARRSQRSSGSTAEKYTMTVTTEKRRDHRGQMRKQKRVRITENSGHTAEPQDAPAEPPE